MKLSICNVSFTVPSRSNEADKGPVFVYPTVSGLAPPFHEALDGESSCVRMLAVQRLVRTSRCLSIR